MKKASIFFIIVICIVSIYIISLFGQAVENGQFKIYMTSIEITNETYNFPNTDIKYMVISYDDDLGYGSVIIEYEYTPDDVTEPDAVSFSLSDNTYVDDNGVERESATVNSYGEVTFVIRDTVNLTLLTTDGGGAKDSVMIICQ